MKIVVGSTSDSKINAVKAVFVGHEVIGVPVNSGVNAQPVGRETWDGAKNRMEGASLKVPDADMYIGIENGIFEKEGSYFDLACICSMRKDEEYKPHHYYSEPVQFDSIYVDTARVRGFKTVTVGMVMKEQGIIEDAADPHKSLTGVSREEYLKKALEKIYKPNRYVRGAILAGTVFGLFGLTYLASKTDLTWVPETCPGYDS